jgi:hypothetical protein
VSPSSTERRSRDVGTTFTVNVTIQHVQDLFGFDLNITWDETLLAFSNSFYQETLDAAWGSGEWFLVENETSPGSFRLIAVSLANSFNTTEEQTIFTLELTVENPLQPGQTPIYFAVHKLSDSQANPITHLVQDGTYTFVKTPHLDMNPAGTTCRKIGETFNVAINVSEAYNVTDFKFAIYYNTTLLNFVNVTWNAWLSGTISVDNTTGMISGYTSGDPISGTQVLMTLDFNAAFHHVWKSGSNWTNDLTDTIFLQWANLSYATRPDLHYEKGGINQFDVGPDFAYTFSPIQGDVNNNGTVDVFDLRTIAAYYDSNNPDYNLSGDSVIDIYDLVVVGSNFWYIYVP